jgi:hypothetical protein
MLLLEAGWSDLAALEMAAFIVAGCLICGLSMWVAIWLVSLLQRSLPRKWLPVKAASRQEAVIYRGNGTRGTMMRGR